MTILTETLRLHALWLEGAEGGKRLTRANMEGANLTGADLTHARLRGADLEGANLGGALGLAS